MNNNLETETKNIKTKKGGLGTDPFANSSSRLSWLTKSDQDSNISNLSNESKSDNESKSSKMDNLGKTLNIEKIHNLGNNDLPQEDEWVTVSIKLPRKTIKQVEDFHYWERQKNPFLTVQEVYNTAVTEYLDAKGVEPMPSEAREILESKKQKRRRKS